jgi:hypothetical protein
MKIVEVFNNDTCQWEKYCIGRFNRVRRNLCEPTIKVKKVKKERKPKCYEVVTVVYC